MSDSQSKTNRQTLLPQDVEQGNAVAQKGIKDHRTLAISSIICGLSCIGILSLIYSVKVREMNKRKPNPGEADMEANTRKYSKKAQIYGILAILLWVAILISFPLLTGLVSYLLTLID